MPDWTLSCVLALACLSGTAAGSPAQTLSLQASFAPNELGASSNLAVTVAVASSKGVPPPVSDLVTYAPAGLRLDLRGVATCQRAWLEADGPQGCPERSRVGFGGGVGAFDLAGAPVKEPYTLDLFLGPREDAHTTILIYADAIAPVGVQLVLSAKEIGAPKPYGFGLAVEVPAIPTVPGASDASMESGYVSLGGANVAYFQTSRGKRKLVHVKGLTVPSTCPSGGFPFQAQATFTDGTSATGSFAAPCPDGRG